jgi:hypothetical protein
LQQRAIGLASSYLAGGLTHSLRDTLGLDVFDLSAGEVRIGRYGRTTSSSASRRSSEPASDRRRPSSIACATPERPPVDVDERLERHRRPLASPPLMRGRTAGDFPSHRR